MRILFPLLASVFIFSACAKVTIRPVKPDEAFDQTRADKQMAQTDKYYETEGVRFYRPYPYLWITVAEKGACQMSITYLPKMDEEFIITAKTGIGSVTMNPQLASGWMITGLTATADSKANEMVTAIGSLTGNVAKAASGQALLSKGKQFGPGLYRMIFKDGFVDDLQLVFLQGEKPEKPALCAELKPPGQS